jgi:hypothetical protein
MRLKGKPDVKSGTTQPNSTAGQKGRVIMRYLTAILGVLFFSVVFSDVAIARKHGATITWDPSKSTATCTSPCRGTYLIFEGPGRGKEDMTKPFASTTKLSFVDDEPKEGAYRGTTRCYVVRYQKTIRKRVTVAESSNETCVSFQ